APVGNHLDNRAVWARQVGAVRFLELLVVISCLQCMGAEQFPGPDRLVEIAGREFLPGEDIKLEVQLQFQKLAQRCFGIEVGWAGRLCSGRQKEGSPQEQEACKTSDLRAGQ